MSTVFIEGQTQERARELLGMAKSLGLPASVVRSTDNGFIVPSEIAEGIDGGPKTRRQRRQPAGKSGA